MEPISSDITEYGLLLPNGQVLWNNYNNRSLETEADRHLMVQVLCKTAEECGFPEEQFTANYQWVCRRVETTVTPLGVFALHDSEVLGVDNTPTKEDSHSYDSSDLGTATKNTADSDSDSLGGDLLQGCVGGSAPGSA